MPITRPDVLTIATVLSLVLHVPPTVVVLREVVRPGHTSRVPVIAAGRPLTVTVVNARQPVGAV
jgi:hypothetical protein